ncbi:hypothetical protein [Staphylococcus hominis]|uniref:hypothetical protein n=1 Tax=Staphylococcus hominis TaxID=1290 RepID=UPI001475194A|nr:hypothetical protein [Staphylococcus hominis]NMD91157.1 hypothetical protein [Staphylococcus hominis]
MVKIKRKVEMTLPELIAWAWKNDVKGKSFNSKKQINALHFDMYGGIQTHCGIEKNDSFTVETEEEVTEETEIPEMLEIFQDNDGTQWFGNSIEQLKDDFSREFWLKDGDTMTLIWKDGELVGDE